MRRQMVAGNWKMNGSRVSVEHLLAKIKRQTTTINEVEVAIFPSYIFLELTERVLKNSSIKWGAQTVSEQANGAVTGEISAAMLADFNCHYVLVGHSERRQKFHESEVIVAAKYKAALAAKIAPIVCVGETLAQRQAGQTFEVIKQQLLPILTDEQGLAGLQQAVIAYEPVWAIGTGQTASPENAQEIHGEIRSFIASYDKLLAEDLRILYGGSVKPENAAALFAMPDIDGGLIGGASLNVDEFMSIIKSCKPF